MAIEVRMPKLSDNMEAGTIIRWLKQPGDKVQHGEALAEVETDKADVELEAENAGVLREIKVNEGQSAEVGAVIALLAGEGEATDSRDEKDAGGEAKAAERAPAGDGRKETKPAPATREKPARRETAPPASREKSAGREEPAPAEEAEESEKSAPAEEAEGAGESEKAAKAEEAEEAGESEKAAKAEKAEKANKTGKAEKGDEAEAVAPAPREKPAPADDGVRSGRAPSTGAGQRPSTSSGQGPTTSSGQGPTTSSGQGILRASPLAWRMAEEAGVSLANVKGSGPGGRILKRDVETLLAEARKKATDGERKRAGAPASAPAQTPAATEARDGGGSEPEADEQPAAPAAKTRVEEQSRMRLTIARRMAEANREIPHFYLTTEIDMSEAWRLRQSIKESETIPGLTLTHVIIKALALALPHHPRVNAFWHDGGVELHDDVNIGIAVAVEDGLILPVLHQVQTRPLRDIAAAVASLAEKARSGRFSGQDLTGATFSVSNLGMLEVDEFSAVITPPQAAILAVGSVKERPVVRAGQLTVARTMRVTLSCDHRVLNGVEGGRFLEELKSLLEQPYVLLVE